MKFFTAAILAIVVLTYVTAEGVYVNTTTGKVRGQIEKTIFEGIKVQKFINIPYAEAPVGKLRFMKPEPKNSWKGILKTPKDPLACPQSADVPFIQSEDCLVVHVWTPHPRPKGATVMVYVHGGGYTRGAGAEFAGHTFVAAAGDDIILVTINYRLFHLGFLVSNDESIRGNMGLFDQRLAFKWVNKNIEAFGGDPNKVTLFGESSGSGSVSSHFFSEKSWPYFQRAILQSGSISFSYGIVPIMSVAKAMSLKFINAVNCPNDERALECLQNLTTYQVLEHYHTSKYSMTTDFLLPVVDGDFYPDIPAKLLEQGKHKKLDIMLGVCQHEAFLWKFGHLHHNQSTSYYVKHFKNSLQSTLQGFSKNALKTAMDLYLPECTPNFIEALRPTIEFQTDKYWSCETAKLARSWSTRSVGRTYLYRFSYAPPLDLLLYYPQGSFGFAAHAADLVATFGYPIKNRLFPDEDRILSSRMIAYWTNFAKNGDPNVGVERIEYNKKEFQNLTCWPQFTKNSESYIEFKHLYEVAIGKNIRQKYCEFWNDPEGFTQK